MAQKLVFHYLLKKMELYRFRIIRMAFLYIPIYKLEMQFLLKKVEHEY